MKEEIKVCKHCGKVDITFEHEETCNPEFGEWKRQRDDNFWK